MLQFIHLLHNLNAMFLKQIKLADLDPNKKYVVLVPVGSTEQHGPYIPYGSDTYMTDAIVEVINQQFPDLLILPTLEYSSSKEHQGFIGTLWLEDETLKLVFRDVCTSIEGIASKIIFFSEHGGNLHVIQEYLAEQEGIFNNIPLHHLRCDDQVVDQVASEIMNGPVDSHAGNSEISVLLSLQSKLTTIPNKDDPKTPLTSDPWETGRLKDKSKDGIADPNPEWLVSEELGDRLVEVMKENTIQNLSKILDI